MRRACAHQGWKMRVQPARTDFRIFFYWLNTPPWTIKRGSSTFLEISTVKFPLVCRDVHHDGPCQCLLCMGATSMGCNITSPKMVLFRCRMWGKRVAPALFPPPARHRRAHAPHGWGHSPHCKCHIMLTLSRLDNVMITHPG